MLCACFCTNDELITCKKSVGNFNFKILEISKIA